jgi:uncharacterized protein YndB with AHSA1/START domain
MNGLNNMSKGLIAKASISINAPVGKVWDALTNPEAIKQYMFGTNVISDWKKGRVQLSGKENGKERNTRIGA